MADHTIELRKVSKYYAGEDTVSLGFSRIDLNLDMGDFVAITGESGSGKSTLLNIISGLDTYDEGEMFVCGEDTAGYGTEDYEIYRKTYIGNIFQDFNLINSYSVYQNIETVMLLGGKKKSECKEKILELIDLVGLNEYTKTKASRLSGGQKQRVAIARALAKDAPIIVADEPTGNLDSASAKSVMETLSRVSANKLVVIVTHNYEQAEPYVTRKLTMHDGKIIEDKFIKPPRNLTDNTDESAEFDTEHVEENTRRHSAGRTSRRSARHSADEKAYNSMRKGSELRLGLRNSFNLPTKFLLLLIVYLFVTTSVLSQYASTKNSSHEGDLLGFNNFFVNSDTRRIVVTKEDKTSFTNEEITKIEKIKNIEYVVPNDLALDKGVNFTIGDFYVEGSVYPTNMVDENKLKYGSMPKNDYEIVIETDPSNSSYEEIVKNGKSMVGKKVVLEDMDGMQTYKFGHPVRIAGIIIDDNTGENVASAMYGYSKVYISESMQNKMLITMMASSSRTEINFNGTKVKNSGEYEKSLYSSDKVPKGQAYILEDQSGYYNEGRAVGEDIKVKAENIYFESKISLEVGAVITSQNSKALLGIDKEEILGYNNCIFMNDKDFNTLFDKGNYQISAFMDNELKSDDTVETLNGMGYKTLLLKDTLTDITGGFSFVIQLMTYLRLILGFVVLFYIAYAVIKLIMRSRNSYYSTLRILGATKKNTDIILRVELIIMMTIAYMIDIIFVLLVKKGIINIRTISKHLMFLTVYDYVILAVLLLVMSLLLSSRYSRKIFNKSAMKTFREEV